MNCFFVHTPMQLLMAQNLVAELSLRDNIIILSTINNNNHFYSIYNCLLINSLWSNVYTIDGLSCFVSLYMTKPYNVNFVKKYLASVNRILNKHNVFNLFFGDPNNISYRFLSILFRPCKVNYFEEGTSHYIELDFHRMYFKSIVKKIYFNIVKIFTYKFFKVDIYEVYSSSYFEKLSVSDARRYNVLPLNSREYDYLLPFRVNVPDQLIDKLINSISYSGVEINLFLSQPLFHYSKALEFAGVVALENKIELFSKNLLIVKFHPRERDSVKTKYINMLKKNNVNYQLFPDNLNVPIEVLLGLMKIKYIISFGSSSTLYFKYIQNTDSINLIDDVIKLNNMEDCDLLTSYRDSTKKLLSKL